MKSTFVCVTLILFSACAEKQNSIFFESCSCEKIDFSKGKTYSDTLDHYSAKFLESDWEVVRNLDEYHNGLTWYNSNSEKLEAIAITETKKGESFVSAEKEMKQYPFNQILDSGEVSLFDAQHSWRLFEHDDQRIPYYSIYVTIDKEEVNYTINFTVEREGNYQVKFCRLENFLEHFKLNQ